MNITDFHNKNICINNTDRQNVKANSTCGNTTSKYNFRKYISQKYSSRANRSIWTYFIPKYFPCILVSLLTFVFSPLAYSQNATTDDLVSPEEAFIPEVIFDSANQNIKVDWKVADGYYLYRDKISILINDNEIDRGALNLPKGKIKDDVLFGLVETYFNSASAQVFIDENLTSSFNKSDNKLTVKFQGCHEPLGICYPPQQTIFDIDQTFATTILANNEATQRSQSISSSSQANPLANSQSGLLSDATSQSALEPMLEPMLEPSLDSSDNDQSGIQLSTSLNAISTDSESQGLQNAQEFTIDGTPIFTIASYSVDSKTIVVNVNIPTDYYLYKDQFNFVSLTPNIWINDIQYSGGTVYDDPEFGNTEVYFQQANITLSLSRYQVGNDFPIEIRYQGCKVGSVCLSPAMEEKQFTLLDIEESDLNDPAERDSQSSSPTNSTEMDLVETSSTETDVKDKSQNTTTNDMSLWWILLTAFGAGLLLTFTPCVLPMIPILAGILQKQNQRQEKSPDNQTSHGIIAIAYVLGTAVTYAFIGGVAGASGEQLQAYFQSPIIIALFSGLLFIMALSMFGLFNIQLPGSLQNKLNNITIRDKSSGILSYAFIMGLVSALIVGACVSPVLISVVSLVVKQGNLWFGALTLFVMALGMGVILIAFAFGAKSIMPKSGKWMKHVNQLMGFLLISVAIYLLSSLKGIPILLIWAIFLYVFGYFVFSIAKLSQSILLRALLSGVAIFIFTWGALSTVGALLGNNNMMQPINPSNFQSTNVPTIADSTDNNTTTVDKQKSVFNAVTKVSEFDQLITNSDKEYVLIDYYADWCKDCIRMEKTTYTDSQVLARLAEKFLVIKVDVTDSYSDDAKELKQRFQVYGPPASIFLDKYGAMMTELNFYGYRDVDAFLLTLDKVLARK